MNPAANQALTETARNGDLAGVQAALNDGADVNHVDDIGWTALWWAASKGYTDIARLLIEHGADVNHADAHGYTVLSWTATKRYPDIVRLLIEHGADVNHVNDYGYTVLMMAACSGRTDIVRVLIGHGADVNPVANSEGFTILSCVIHQSTITVRSWRPRLLATARLLIEHGARIPTEEELQRPNQLNPRIPNLEQPARQFLSEVFEGNELAYAAARGDTKHVAELLSTPSQAQPQSPQAKSLTAQLRKPLASYAILPPAIPPQPLNINHQDSHGMTALHWAAAQGHNDIVKLLLDFGANINLQNAEGNTPLHLAARNGNVSTVRLLLARGANATIVNRQGQTPLALAQQYHQRTVVGLLAGEAGRAVFGRVSQAGRAGEFAWQPTPTGATLPAEIAHIIAQFAQAPGQIPSSGSVS